MFTGLVEEIGKVNKIQRVQGGLLLEVNCSQVLADLKVDDSISIDGACQTVIKKSNNSFFVESVEETLRKTIFSKYMVGRRVNLERARKFEERIGGHFVQGHIDCVGKITKITKEGLGRLLFIQIPIEFKKFLIPQGSIAINGVSLTIANVNNNQLMVAIIPYTWENTNLQEYYVGDFVNIEFDYLSKIVVHYLESFYSSNHTDKGNNPLSFYYEQPL
ncbi:MAG: riboflavin synthase [Candidatus Kapaibacteriales bacterium]